jgi:isopentenyldiphosphate isomerase
VVLLEIELGITHQEIAGAEVLKRLQPAAASGQFIPELIDILAARSDHSPTKDTDSSASFRFLRVQPGPLFSTISSPFPGEEESDHRA